MIGSFVFAACCAILAPLQAGVDDFLSSAADLKAKESWNELFQLSEAALQGNPDLTSALAAKAIAEAGLSRFSDAAGSLADLEKAGHPADSPLAGMGAPMVEVVNLIYSKCWANFDPAFNRECWSGLFEQLPHSRYAPVAASRLLMAALKEEAAADVGQLEDFFRERMDAAEAGEDAAGLSDLQARYVDGYLKAGRCSEEVLALAEEAWASKWQAATETHGLGEAGVDPAKAQLECELDTDKDFNKLALATFLRGELREDSPLLAMEAEPSVRFEDITESSGLAGLKQTRVAAADFDRDGDVDLCFGGLLYENRKGRFEDVTAERGLGKRGPTALFGDFDGDGNLDLLVATNPKLTLYRNLGRKGKFLFEDVSASSGVQDAQLDAGAEGAAWVDFDDDGDLDLYCAVYENGGSGHPDVLLENIGKGRFTPVGEKLGVTGVGPFCGRGVSPVDADGDGDSEIFVSNYRLNENLFWSLEEGALRDQSSALGIKGDRQPEDGKYFGHTIGSCWGDIDNDGDLDLFSANLAHPRFIRQGFSNLSFLGIRGEDGKYPDERAARGIRFQETHSDPAFIDIDNDGDLDLSITCVYEGVPSVLYQNDGNGHFQPITFRAGAAAFHAWGQSWFDFDGDGFLDVLYASANGVRLLRNTGNDHHYLRVSLQSKGKDKHAFGAIVTIEEMDSESPRRWVRQLVNARGTGSQDEPILHFGLGDYAGRVKVQVRWPDTDRTESKTPKPDRVYVIKQARKAS